MMNVKRFVGKKRPYHERGREESRGGHGCPS